jgi:hypothetical protein
VGLTYQSGELVRQRDRVRYHGEPGYVEFVADVSNPEDWYVQEFGGGCMLVVNSMGHVFLSTTQVDEDLELVGRAE